MRQRSARTDFITMLKPHAKCLVLAGDVEARGVQRLAVDLARRLLVELDEGMPRTCEFHGLHMHVLAVLGARMKM